MERTRLKFIPEWKGSIEGWSHKYCLRHLWRVKPEYEHSDLMAEAYLVFRMTAKRYGAKSENAAHFMSLYKRCLMTQIADLAEKRMKRKEVHASVLTEDGSVQDLINTLPSNHTRIDDLEIQMLLQDLPDPVATAINAILAYDRSHPQTNEHREKELEVVTRPPFERNADGTREEMSQYLCRLAGIDATMNMAEMIKNLFAGKAQACQGAFA